MELEYNTVDNDGAKYISESESNGNVLDEMEMIENGDSFSSNTVENDKRSDTKKNLRIWTNTACTRRLIELYHELLPKVGRYGRFQKKIQMFKYIANKINKEFGENYTGDQVAGRLKNFYRGRNKHLKPPDLNKSLKGISNSSTVHVDISNYNLESMFDSEDDEKCSQVKGSGKNEHEKSSSKAEFTNQQSKKLIRLYNLFIPNVGSNNQFKSKREVFEAISEEMEHEFNIKYSYSQWESRYKTIVRKAKRLISRENQLKLIEQKNNTSEVEYADTKNAKTIHEYSESDMENENYTQDSISMEDVFIENDDDNNHSSLHEKSFPKNEEKEEESITNLDQFNTKILKFFDKDLMKEYLKMKERKIKLEEIRHNEIMEQLRKMNRTLLEMKYQC